jgi:hypothetical protein
LRRSIAPSNIVPPGHERVEATVSTDLDEGALSIILQNAGLSLTPEQVRAILPGAAIVRGMVERVRQPMPREAEPAAVFKPDQQR